MKCCTAFGFLMLLVCAPASASCIVEPLEPQLRAADTVYVGTVVRSALVPDLADLRAASGSRERRAEIVHDLVPEMVLKGDPAKAPTVMSTWQYNDPRSGIVKNLAERSVLMPGDTLLVVARSGEPTRYGLCTSTREWNPHTAKIVRGVFPSFP